MAPDLVTVLRPRLPAIAEAVIEAIGREVPDYSRPLRGEFGRNVRRGVEVALGRFFEQLRDPDRPSGDIRGIYVELGRGEFRNGRSLDALLRAYRVGARVTWRRCVEAGRTAGVEPDELYALGETMFAYIDGLSAESTEGYAQAQSAAAGERLRERRRLVSLLLQSPPADPHAVADAAQRAGWAVPATVAVLVTDAVDPDALASRLGAGVIAAEADDLVLALVPDPEAPRRRAELARALDGTPAALGPAVAPDDVPASADRARLAHRLLTLGILPDRLAVAEEHLTELVLHADPRLGRDLAARALAPLDELPARSRARLEETLRAWLDHQGRMEQTAATLGVHPQTVRYRLGRLRERLGSRLDDPAARFDLALALRLRG